MTFFMTCCTTSPNTYTIKKTMIQYHGGRFFCVWICYLFYLLYKEKKECYHERKKQRRGKGVSTVEGTGSPISCSEIWISSFHTPLDKFDGDISPSDLPTH